MTIAYHIIKYIVLLNIVIVFELNGLSQNAALSSFEGIIIEKLPLGFSPPFSIKDKIEKRDVTLKKELKRLLATADRIMEADPPSVMNDSTAPAGIDCHDYVSYAPYWWPDPDSENGLPYIRKDGVINHELRNKGDDKALELMAYSVHLLGLAYFYSEGEKYALKAENFLTVWFLDSTTVMNL
jgi:hypothetical protein